MKTTYLLGAGASFNSIPIVGELQIAFKEIENWINAQFPDEDLPKGKKILSALLSVAAKNTEVFGTIDTFAKKLSLTHPTDLKKTKAALTVFFTLWQEIPKMIVTAGRTKPIQDIDQRYLGLLSNYINRSNSRFELNNDVNFITWNYDTQLERAIGLLVDYELESVLQFFNVYPGFPRLTEEIPQILHLNGIAGLYKKNVSDGAINSIFESKDRPLRKRLQTLLAFIEAAETSEIHHADYFSYAWESDDVSRKAIEYALNMINETEVLVIIGYSFPTFNDIVDKRLMSQLMNTGKLKKVYYQDPNASAEILTARFGIPESSIKIIHNTAQFILPLDSHSLNPLFEVH